MDTKHEYRYIHNAYVSILEMFGLNIWIITDLKTDLIISTEKGQNWPSIIQNRSLYPPLHFWIRNTLIFILGDHKYPQELTPNFFSDLACHMRLIPPSKRHCKSTWSLVAKKLPQNLKILPKG